MYLATGEGGKGKKHCAVNLLRRPVPKHCDGREETFQGSTRARERLRVIASQKGRRLAAQRSLGALTTNNIFSLDHLTRN
jgi:hypothetical protein